MRTSEQINEIAGALAAAQMAFPAIKKGKTANVGTYSYAYADLADIFDAVRPILAGKGIATIQVMSGNEQGYELTTRLMHSSGQWVETDFPLRMAGKIQEVGSELTYARRYALCGILGIAAEEDDDGKAANETKQQPRQQQRPPQRPQAVKPLDDEGERFLIQVDEAFDARERDAQVGEPTFTFTREDRRKIRDGIAKTAKVDSVSNLPPARRPELLRKILDGAYDGFRAAAKQQPVGAA